MADADGPPDDAPGTLEPIDPPRPGATEPADAAARSFGAPVVEPGTVHVFVGPDRTRIVLAGEIDTELGPELQEAATAAERARLPVEVDAHHVTFMDSSGVAFLARLSTRSTTPVRLVRVPPTVRFLLEVTRIGELLDVADDDLGPG